MLYRMHNHNMEEDSSTSSALHFLNLKKCLFPIVCCMLFTISMHTNTMMAQMAKDFHNNSCLVADNSEYISISKETMTLKLFDKNGEILLDFPVACGSNYGNKQKTGDRRTPEGRFYISEVKDASKWVHDFHDGKGTISGAYGPWFIRLECPGHSGIGIHGTHDSKSIGTRCTEGCVRLTNANITELKEKVSVGMIVVIEPSKKDIIANNGNR